ncbi:MAG: hypothetical protein U5R31_15600 [Acidimicrobiia bacterium]|nr:hypothetical protein [Acidimicrobiia bacterium]
MSQTGSWWGEPYLGPEAGTMRIQPELGGKAFNGRDVATGTLHGTVRAFDLPERLEIGGVLVPGAYAGGITITVEKTKLGSEIRVEQMARAHRGRRRRPHRPRLDPDGEHARRARRVVNPRGSTTHP